MTMRSEAQPAAGPRTSDPTYQSFEAGESPERLEARAWLFYGICSGVLGAAVIAVFFLVIDLFKGHALWTPAALGSSIFLGETLQPGASPPFVLVAGYTLLHGAAFVAFGLIAAYVLIGFRRRNGGIAAAGLAAGLFAAFEFFFVAFLWVLSPELLGDFGLGQISVANALAAVAMAVVLVRAPLRQEEMRRENR